MKIGYFAVGIGIGAEPENMTVTAQTADQAGFPLLVGARACGAD